MRERLLIRTFLIVSLPAVVTCIIVKLPENQVGLVNDSVLFTCRSDTRQSSITWWRYFNDGRGSIKLSGASRSTYPDLYELVDGTDLRIKSVQSVDQGLYACLEVEEVSHAALLFVINPSELKATNATANCSFSRKLSSSHRIQCNRLSTSLVTRITSQFEYDGSVGETETTFETLVSCVTPVGLQAEYKFCSDATFACATNVPVYRDTCNVSVGRRETDISPTTEYAETHSGHHQKNTTNITQFPTPDDTGAAGGQQHYWIFICILFFVVLLIIVLATAMSVRSTKKELRDLRQVVSSQPDLTSQVGSRSMIDMLNPLYSVVNDGLRDTVRTYSGSLEAEYQPDADQVSTQVPEPHYAELAEALDRPRAAPRRNDSNYVYADIDHTAQLVSSRDSYNPNDIL